MEMREKILLGALAAIGAATPAYAQISPTSGPQFNGTIGGAASTTSATCGTTTCSTSATTGDSTGPTYVNTVTTTTNLVLNTSKSGSTTGTVTFNGDSQPYRITGSGVGTQQATITTSLRESYAPGVGTNPPTVVGSTTSSSGVVPTAGTQSISSLSVSGCSGDAYSPGIPFFVPPSCTSNLTYAGTLSSAGSLNSDGSVNVTENTVGVTTSGMTYATYTGTATFNPGTGAIAVAMNSTPTAYTNIGSGGLTTNGTVSATTVSATNVNATNVTAANVSVTGGLNMNGNRITNVGTPTALTDAANKGYVDSQIATVSGSISSLASLVEANRKRSDAGIATAVALSGASFLPGKRINVTANIGAFRDEVAIAGQLGVLVSDNVALNAGVSTSFHSYGGTSVRGGVTFGF